MKGLILLYLIFLFHFFYYKAGPVWVGKNDVETGNRSLDGGKTWAFDKRDILFGSLFFVS